MTDHLTEPKNYSSFQRLSPDTHSSAHIFCYYNPECLNQDFKHFIKLADCERSFYFFRGSISKYIRLIDILLDILEGKRKSYRKNSRYSSLVIEMKFFQSPEKDECSVFNIRQRNGPSVKSRIEFISKDMGMTKIQQAMEIRNAKIIYRLRTMLTIHKDKITCNEEQWKNKINIMKSELLKFKAFLNQVQGNKK